MRRAPTAARLAGSCGTAWLFALALVAPACRLAAVDQRSFGVHPGRRPDVADALRIIVRGIGKGDRVRVALAGLEPDRRGTIGRAVKGQGAVGRALDPHPLPVADGIAAARPA